MRSAFRGGRRRRAPCGGGGELRRWIRRPTEVQRSASSARPPEFLTILGVPEFLTDYTQIGPINKAQAHNWPMPPYSIAHTLT